MATLADTSLLLPCDTSHDAVLTDLWVIKHCDIGIGTANKDLVDLMVPFKCYYTVLAYRCLAHLLTCDRAETYHETMAIALSH